jgi:hypothetical protein
MGDFDSLDDVDESDSTEISKYLIDTFMITGLESLHIHPGGMRLGADFVEMLRHRHDVLQGIRRIDIDFNNYDFSIEVLSRNCPSLEKVWLGPQYRFDRLRQDGTYEDAEISEVFKKTAPPRLLLFSGPSTHLGFINPLSSLRELELDPLDSYAPNEVETLTRYSELLERLEYFTFKVRKVTEKR